VLGTLGLQILLLHSPVASRLFKTMVLPWPDLVSIAMFALIPWAILEIVRVLRRVLSERRRRGAGLNLQT
jgi:hypothetical protein